MNKYEHNINKFIYNRTKQNNIVTYQFVGDNSQKGIFSCVKHFPGTNYILASILWDV